MRIGVVTKGSVVASLLLISCITTTIGAGLKSAKDDKRISVTVGQLQRIFREIYADALKGMRKEVKRVKSELDSTNQSGSSDGKGNKGSLQKHLEDGRRPMITLNLIQPSPQPVFVVSPVALQQLFPGSAMSSYTYAPAGIYSTASTPTMTTMQPIIATHGAENGNQGFGLVQSPLPHSKQVKDEKQSFIIIPQNN